MKKYFMSFVDFSEIDSVTTDSERLETARNRMSELGLLTEKGNPSSAQIGNLVSSVSPPFFEKLARKLARRRGGIRLVHDILQQMYEKQEFTAMFLYLAIEYGFMEWRVPDGLVQLPAVPEALKVYMTKFMEAFDGYLAQESGESLTDDKENM